MEGVYFMKMSYKEYVKDVFIEHQIACGPYAMDPEEAADTFQEQQFSTVEKWLVKNGYDLVNDYNYMYGKG
jgi:hypothetical protein